MPADTDPFFMIGRHGRLFSVLFSPPEAVRSSRPGVLYVPPFADEMNKARRQAALTARALASMGNLTLMLDLYGTGDSDGEFGDATIDHWMHDLEDGLRFLQSRGVTRFVLLGVRFGALLAIRLATREEFQVERVVLWQPVTSGRAYLSQFLRLAAAADMMSGDGRMNVGEWQDRLQKGASVEVAGYDLNPVLTKQLEELDVAAAGGLSGVAVDWLEVVARSGQGLPPASLRTVEKWLQAGVQVGAIPVVGEKFWIAPEFTTVIPELTTATCRALETPQ